MSRTPQAVFDALYWARRDRSAAREADLLALAEHDDDLGDELADREERA